jgi:hypothetical protein
MAEDPEEGVGDLTDSKLTPTMVDLPCGVSEEKSRISPEKIQAYRSTHYRIGLGPSSFVLKIGEKSAELADLFASSGTDCGIFITAFNPFGQKQGHAENEKAHVSLLEQLTSRTQEFIEGKGEDPSGDWPAERSVLALGVEASGACDLGTMFSQDAVVWLGSDAVPRLLLLR